MMASVKDLLLSSLEELVKDDLKLFQWHLVNDNERISKSEMEDANRLKTVDKLVDCFGPEAAVKITVSILRKMKQNLLAERLENKHKQAQMSSGVHTGVSTVLNAQTGGTVNAPVLAGNTTGPVTFNNSIAGHDSHRLTLDLNTAHKSLRLSENNRVISGTLTDHPYPDHPDRFDVFEQVLCEESVSGPCYWEIELRGDAYIAVSYKSISRKGRRNECLFGSNDQSWALYCSRSSYSFWHNNIQPNLSVKPIISRIGVYDDNISRIGVFVDPSAGTLSFYSVYRNTMTLIHSVQTTFTQPLYPGLRVGSGSSVKLC